MCDREPKWKRGYLREKERKKKKKVREKQKQRVEQGLTESEAK